MNGDINKKTEGNYLIIDCDHMGYKHRMLESNRIPGLLPLEIKEEDGNVKLCYDISSKETFDSIAGSRSLRMDDIRSLVFSINNTLKNLDVYLLDADDLILDRKYIYISGEKLKPVFCCCPDYNGDFPSGLSSFLQDLLGMVDSKDRSAVVATYALYQASLKPGYTIDDLIKAVNSNTTETEPHKKSSVKESVQYKNENLELITVSGVEDPRPRAVEDMDELYVSLNADPKKYHFGKAKDTEKVKVTKQKKGLGFLR